MREGVDQVVPKSDRMWRSKTETLEPINLMHCFEQLDKRALAVAAVYDRRRFERTTLPAVIDRRYSRTVLFESTRQRN